jgi:hypothetical protein
MKKKYLFMATAAIMMAGCASDDLVGDETVTQNGNLAIGFGMNTPAMTRSTGKEAATALGNEFIVWGEKNEGEQTYDAAKDIVFRNYCVDYTDGTKNTTLSNTENWEYVGITPYTATSDGVWVSPSILSDNANAKQTIKYWDFNASSYTFTAVSALKDDITNKRIKISKTTAAPTNGTAYDKGYTIELADASASVGKIYVADRKVINKPTTTSTTIDRTADNTYGGNVTLSFRNFQSKIRFGIYETIPGYKVVITGINYNGSNHTATSGDNSSADKFGITGDFVKAGSNTNNSTTYTTKYTVTYRSDSGHEGEAQVTIADNATKASYITTEGTTWLTTTGGIGTASNAPTYDNANAYTPILPNPSNGTNLTLKIAYKLISEDTGEVIEFKNGTDEVYRTVEVPAAYCQWKSNYAYTYLFKISDKSAELYPITFDACVVETETGNQETITEVGEPSITTFAVKDNKIVTDKDEYEDGNTIYATIVEGSSLVTMTSDNIKLYTVTATGKQTISEASVANCLAKGTKNDTTSPTTWTSTAGSSNVLTVTVQSYSADNDLLNVVPSEDGKTVTLDASAKKAIKWDATGDTSKEIYYVVEYKKSDNAKYYKIVKIAKKPTAGN